MRVKSMINELFYEEAKLHSTDHYDKLLDALKNKKYGDAIDAAEKIHTIAKNILAATRKEAGAKVIT